MERREIVTVEFTHEQPPSNDRVQVRSVGNEGQTNLRILRGPAGSARHQAIFYYRERARSHNPIVVPQDETEQQSVLQEPGPVFVYGENDRELAEKAKDAIRERNKGRVASMQKVEEPT